MIVKLKYIALWLLLVAFVSTSFTTKRIPTKPNIIVILIDDAGFADFGFMGSKDLATPNLDMLAAKAMLFTDAHVTASVCSPSRAGLLTGKYQQKFGYDCNEGEGYTGLNVDEKLMPLALKNKGYTTGAFGKWHIGYKQEQQPLQKGFDYYYGFLSGGRSYFYKADKDDKPNAKTAIWENNNQVNFDGYLTDVLSDKAVAFIEKNKQQPFYMYWAPNAVHTPMEATNDDLQRFKNHPRQKLAAMTFALDRAIGKIVDKLKADKLFDNTLIFFLSDNGGAANNQSSNLPLKGFKGNKFEGGHRIPLLVSWPKYIKAKSTFKGLTSALDIYPTALEAAGIKNYEALGLDGISLMPQLKGLSTANPHTQLVWRKDKIAAIRNNLHKLIFLNGKEEGLYNLKTDPAEKNNLITSQPKVVESLKLQFNDWQKDKVKPLWTEGKIWDTITFMIHEDLINNKSIRVTNPEELKLFLSKNKN